MTKIFFPPDGSPFLATFVLAAVAMIQWRLGGRLPAVLIIPGFLQIAPGFLGTIWLNGALLFTVMVYVYPLKFLFALLAGPEGLSSSRQMIRPGQIVQAMVLYGVGFISIFGVLAALYGHAWRKSRRAGLAAKQVEAVEGVWQCLISVLVGAISIGIAVIGGPRATGLAGFSYVLIGPFHFAYRRLIRRRRSLRSSLTR